MPHPDRPPSTASVLAVAFALAAGAASAQSTGTVRGIVVDTAGQAIGPAQVVARGTALGALVDSTGAFVVTGLPLGRHDFEVRAVGYDRWVGETWLRAPGDTIELRVALVPTPIELASICTPHTAPSLVVTVVDSLTSEPPGGTARVVVRDGSFEAELPVGGWDATGRVRAYRGPPEREGTFTVEVEAPGFLPWRRTGVVVGRRNPCNVDTQALTARLRRQP